MKKKCKHCRSVFKISSGQELDICHSCKLIYPYNGARIYQTPCTSHLTKDLKHKIADFIFKNHGALFKIYKESMPFIEKEFDIKIDFKGVRSIVNSEYYRNIAFD